MTKKQTSACECGAKLGYVTTPFLMPEARVCPKCGRIHSVDDAPIDWEVVNGDMGISAKTKSAV